MTVEQLINAFGGTAEAAKRFGVGASAVSNWKKAGRFPERLHFRVFQEAKAAGFTLPADFFGTRSNAPAKPRLRPGKHQGTAAA